MVKIWTFWLPFRLDPWVSLDLLVLENGLSGMFRRVPQHLTKGQAKASSWFLTNHMPCFILLLCACITLTRHNGHMSLQICHTMHTMSASKDLKKWQSWILNSRYIIWKFQLGYNVLEDWLWYQCVEKAWTWEADGWWNVSQPWHFL